MFPVSSARGEHKDVLDRLSAANTVFKEIMDTPDKSIPQELLEKAHCVAVVPGLKKAAFIVGGQYGKGFLFCRSATTAGKWSDPANIRVEGGSFGLQIGGGEVDVVMLVMDEAGAKRLMSSEFKVGAEAGAMAGPVGRTAQASTDAYMRAKMLGYSRSRGVFAGLALEGSTIREDRDDNEALYGKRYTTEEIVLKGEGATPEAARPLLQALSQYSFRER
jgi:lipid-binding SYLF domain-containing protein